MFLITCFMQNTHSHIYASVSDCESNCKTHPYIGFNHYKLFRGKIQRATFFRLSMATRNYANYHVKKDRCVIMRLYLHRWKLRLNGEYKLSRNREFLVREKRVYNVALNVKTRYENIYSTELWVNCVDMFRKA